MKAVILAGGKGTRLMPLTRDIPKPMIKIIDKPVLEHIILLLKKHGITDIAMTLGYRAEQIVSYFEDGSQWGVNIRYYTEDEPLGTAGSVKRTLNFVGEDFLVISGDAYTEINLTRAIAFHLAKGSMFTMVCQPHPHPVGFGVLDIDENSRIISFVEKPENVQPSLINTGIYVINREIMRLVPNGFYDFGKSLIPRLVGNMFAYVDYAYWSDIGTLTGYYATNMKVAKELEQVKS